MVVVLWLAAAVGVASAVGLGAGMGLESGSALFCGSGAAAEWGLGGVGLWEGAVGIGSLICHFTNRAPGALELMAFVTRLLL